MELSLPADHLLTSENGSFSCSPETQEQLYRCALTGSTADGRELDLRLISLEPIRHEALHWSADETVEGVISRLGQQFRYPQALLILVNPEQALGEEHMAHAMGCSLLDISQPSREICWDAALSKGLPIYGIRDELRLSITTLRAASVLSALAFGVFNCRNGSDLDQLCVEDHRQGVRWSAGPEFMESAIILREGYEIHQAKGPLGEWRDRGNEGVVRFRAVFGNATLWSQPRFIMPGAQGMPQSGFAAGGLEP